MLPKLEARAYAVVVGVSLVLSLLTACTPKPDQRAALQVLPNGPYSVWVYLCRGSHFTSVGVYERDGDRRSWFIAPPAKGAQADDPEGLQEVILFSAPKGWDVEEESLLELERDTRYLLDVGDYRDATAQLNFTLADIPGSGDVLYGRADDLHVLDREEFVRAAKKQCS